MDATPIGARRTHDAARDPRPYKKTRLALRVTALVAGLTVALSGTAVAATGNCYSTKGCTETARSAKDFMASVGVNTHLGYTDTVYWRNWPMIRDRLRELGVSHLRDGTFPAHYSTGPTVAARYRETGLGLNLLTGLEQAPSGPGGSGEGLDTRLSWIKSQNLTPQVIGIEGSNESWNDATVIRNLQCDTFNKVKNDPALSSKPVIGPSAGAPFSGTAWYDRIGDLSACLDKGNLHSYPGAEQPRTHQNQDLSVAMGWGGRSYGQKPYWATETGYWNTRTDANGVSERAAGVYLPRATLEYFARGIERTQLYELIDLDTASNNVIDRYGLLRSDGTRKPAFTALANTLAILKDTSEASGSLGFGIVCTANCHSPIRRVLLRHSTGAYFLAVWSESKIWDAGSRRDTPKVAQTVRLSLHQAPAKVEVFDPAVGRTPRSTSYSGAKIVSTAVLDSVRLIKITPRSPVS